MNLMKSMEFFNPADLEGSRVHIIGCGSVGSTIADGLARLGVRKIVLYDFDIVEPHNIVNQMFSTPDIGRLKVDAVEDNIHRINPDCEVKKFDSGWDGQRLSGYVFLCVDSIDLRRRIATENIDNAHIHAMFDFRTRLTDAQGYAADWSDRKQKENFIATMDFTSEEAKASTPMSACNVALSVGYTVRLICDFGVANFVNFIKNHVIKTMTLINVADFTVDAF